MSRPKPLLVFNQLYDYWKVRGRVLGITAGQRLGAEGRERRELKELQIIHPGAGVVVAQETIPGGDIEHAAKRLLLRVR